MVYMSIMSDLVLFIMDRVKVFVEVVMVNGKVEYDDNFYN